MCPNRRDQNKQNFLVCCWSIRNLSRSEENALQMGSARTIAYSFGEQVEPRWTFEAKSCQKQRRSSSSSKDNLALLLSHKPRYSHGNVQASKSLCFVILCCRFLIRQHEMDLGLMSICVFWLCGLNCKTAASSCSYRDFSPSLMHTLPVAEMMQ